METEEILAAIQQAAETIAAPNWADKLALLVSFLAILVAAGVAVYVAKKQNGISEKQADIAEQQNRIALFEKRYELYRLVSKCISLSGLISIVTRAVNNIDDVYRCLAIEFDEISFEDITAQTINSKMMDIINRLELSEFLFSENISKQIQNLSLQLKILVTADFAINRGSSFEDIKTTYCRKAEQFKSNGTLEEMKSEIQP